MRSNRIVILSLHVTIIHITIILHLYYNIHDIAIVYLYSEKFMLGLGALCRFNSSMSGVG